jgi:hypothetical protein
MRHARAALAVTLALTACSAPSRSTDAGPRRDAVAPHDDAGPAAPELAWVGTYRGTYEAMALDCTSGAPLDTDPPSTRERTIEIDADGNLFVDLACAIPLVLTSDTTAIVPSFECDSTLSDGTPVHAQFQRGSADLIGGDELWMETEVTLTYAGNCDEAAEHFTYGARVR